MSDLMHYGTPRHSGRYPWGSGKNPQHNKNFLTRYNELKAKGFSDADIAKGFEMKSASQLKARLYNAKNEVKKENMISAFNMMDDGKSNTDIAKRLGVTEGTIRQWRKMGRDEALGRRDKTREIADALKTAVDTKGYIDVGSGTEYSLNTNASRKKAALQVLQDEGYALHNIQVDQAGTKSGMKTTVQVLAPPGTKYVDIAKDIQSRKKEIATIEDYENADTKVSKLGLPPVESISSSRIKIVYDEEGGTKKDGVIELRRGLDDLNLGGAQYAQVRIGVDGTHYLKGMAMYSDNMPDGVDVIFNTNKKQGTPLEKVLKPMKEISPGVIDQDNPFGASIKSEEDLKRVPRRYIGKDGKEHISPINVVNEEGDWSGWSKTLAAQMLAKQPKELAKKQLDLTYDIYKSELDEIKNLTNPVVKKKLLEDYASNMDSTAVHLKAAGLPRQASKVILPIDSLKDHEIYAPGYKTGETVALVRFPHAGTFEIPVLKVNNYNKEASSVMREAKDAVGINSKVAERLSGADFDGDTVLVIPTGGSVKIKSSPPLEGLKDFDPKKEYAITDRKEREAAGEKLPKKLENKAKQVQMGIVTNLITDMTIQNAPEEDMAKAVKHSMVVIDGEKHDLDYRRSYKDNEIDRLRATYQIQPDGSIGGAATLISRAKSQQRVDTRDEVHPKKEFAESDEYYGQKLYRDRVKDTYVDKKKNTKLVNEYNKLKKQGLSEIEIATEMGRESPKQLREEMYTPTGKIKHRQFISTKMAEANDARELISEYNTPIEREYAKYANRLKSLANEARKEYYTTDNPHRDPAAAKKYAPQVESLEHKLEIAQRNAPRERQAQLMANKIIAMKKEEYPDKSDDADWNKKIRNDALRTARDTYGAHKTPITIEPKEWEAIQSHAIGSTKLRKILDNADMKVVREMAMPKRSKPLSASQEAIAKTMKARGFTTEEIAQRVGVSASTILKVID